MNKVLKRIATVLAVVALATGASVTSAHADPGKAPGRDTRIPTDTSWSQ